MREETDRKEGEPGGEAGQGDPGQIHMGSCLMGLLIIRQVVGKR
jgi:hypothetical protein